MVRRIAAGGLVTCGLFLVPGSSPAQGEGAPDPPPAARARSLEERVLELERARAAYEEALREQERLEERVQELESEKREREQAAERERERLERRIEELETAKVAHEDATRTIIAQKFSEWGSKINEFVDFGGVLEVLPAYTEDFSTRDPVTNQLSTQGDQAGVFLNTAELQFEIQVTDWARGSLVLEYDDGADLSFATDEGEGFSIDRINIDTAYATFGNTERFWPYASFGRMIVPFGISTGDPVADVLTIVDPLTVEVFETRADALLFGLEFPTPPPRPEAVTLAPPRVRPLVVAPALELLGRLLGYRPFPAPPPAPEYVPLRPDPPPFLAGVYFYDGDTFEKASREGEWDPEHHMGGMFAYRTRGTCRPYLGGQQAPDERLSWLHVACPWTLDLGVEYIGSVFDSNFLNFEYRGFTATREDFGFGLDRIGFVPGMAASVKATLGPVGLVAEWNGALHETDFFDDSVFGPTGMNERISIRPRAWQVALAYQFDWNPSVEAIGSQGTYVTVAYSASRDLAGAMRAIFGDRGAPTLARVGFIPRRRLLVGAGEWVLPNLRLAIEWGRDWDYSKGHGGTNQVADAILSMVTFEW
jgi:hypothetical protein